MRHGMRTVLPSSERPSAVSRRWIPIAAASAVAACGTAPMSFLHGQPKTVTDVQLYPVRVVSVDGAMQFHSPVQVEPGPRLLVLEAAPSGSARRTEMQTFAMRVEPCTRYYLAARRTSPMAAGLAAGRRREGDGGRLRPGGRAEEGQTRRHLVAAGRLLDLQVATKAPRNHRFARHASRAQTHARMSPSCCTVASNRNGRGRLDDIDHHARPTRCP